MVIKVNGLVAALESHQLNSVAGQVTLELIARTAHEAVRSLAQSYGDNSHQSWEDSPEWVRVSGMNGAALHVLNPELSAEQTHEAWLKAKQEEGWSCGPTKDADRKEHPCMVPYAELSREHRLKDYLFKSIVDAFMACLREDNPEIQVVGLECTCSGLEQRYEGSLDGRTGLAVSLEGGLIGKIKEWFLGDDKDLPADLDEALRKTNGEIKQAWLNQQEFDTGTIKDEGLVEDLTYGDKPLNGTDFKVVSEGPEELRDWIGKAASRWNSAIADCRPLIESGLKAKKFDTDAIRATIIGKMPQVKIRLPKGLTFECDGKSLGLNNSEIGTSVPMLKAENVLEMQAAFQSARAIAPQALAMLHGHFLDADDWQSKYNEIAKIQDSSENWIGDSLSMSWYFEPIVQSLMIISSNRSALVNWVKASVKAKK